MSARQRASRRDSSEAAIIEALEAYGFSVQRLNAPNVPDLLLGKHGITRVVEVKTGRAPLTEGQRRWWASWRGNGAIVLRSVDQVPTLARFWTAAINLTQTQIIP